MRAVRLPLGRTSRRFSFERRLRFWLTALGLPAVMLSALLVLDHSHSNRLAAIVAAGVALAWALACSFFLEQIIRPLQTLSNVVAALRENDFSFRARGARRGDTLGDLAFEINSLAGTLQQQRSAARDALTLVERVLTSMPSPVLAFDEEGRLRLLNTAARNAFSLAPFDPIGRTAPELDLAELLAVADQGLYPTLSPMASGPEPLLRWSVRRVTFRLHGLPHTLLVLTDVAAALRQEERMAWQRLIRVLSHEMNNSLTPIKSIAGSLRVRLKSQAPERISPSGLDQLRPDLNQLASDLLRGLTVIEDRAASLNRFLQAYQRLTRLPIPCLQPTSVAELVGQVAALETRMPLTISAGASTTLVCDPDQIQQALINLVQNAVDAALSRDASAPGRTPAVHLSWSATAIALSIRIDDNGPGIANPANLFVPFYTTKPQGSGIGLVLAQQIASSHHGLVTLRQIPGVPGTSAELVLPLTTMSPTA